MKKLLLLFAVMLMGLGVMAQTTYTKVTSESSLNAGDKVLLVGFNDDGAAYVMSYQKSSNRHAVAVDVTGNVINTTVATSASSQTEPFEITIGGSAGAWTFFDELSNGYLYAPGGGNYLKTQTNNDNKGEWTLSMDGEGFIPVSNGGAEQNIMHYNPNTQNNSPLFGCYKPTSSVTGLVYIFKAGAPVVNPEPTNYPTNFAAYVDDLKVTLTWTDATGEQLPSKYLVMGAMGEVEVPVDGIPYDNGELVMNVNYGVQTVTFNNLDGNTVYTFAIFPYTNSGENIDYKTDGDYPVVRVTIAEIDKLLYEDFDNGLGGFTEYSRSGDQIWEQASYNGITYADMNGYAEGSAHENEDWLISPEIPFDRDAITLEFRTARKYGDANITSLHVKVSSDFTGGDPGTDGYWEDITGLFNFSSGNFEWVESGQVNIKDYVPNQMGFFHVAFVYTSTDEDAAHWEIDYVRVLGGMVSVEEHEAAAINVYPNPAHDVLSFSLDNDAQVSVFDMTGRVVSVMNLTAGEAQCSVANFESGVYFLNIRYADGKTQVARFVKF